MKVKKLTFKGFLSKMEIKTKTNFLNRKSTKIEIYTNKKRVVVINLNENDIKKLIENLQTVEKIEN